MRISTQIYSGSALGIVLLSGIAVAQIPQRMSYQGIVTNSSGQPVANGNYQMTFRIYDDPTSPTPLWTEIQSTVPVTRGLFNVILGSIVPLNLPFDKQYWIGTSINGNAELTPRTMLTAAPYSFSSHNADSARAVPLNAISTGNIQNGAVTLQKLDATGSTAGQVLTSNGTELVWQTPASAGVTSFNGQTGAITLNGAGGTIITRNGNEFTISGSGGISSINSADAAIAITNPTGPAVTLSMVPGGITEPLLGDDAVTSRKIRDGSITSADIAAGTIGTISIADNSVTSAKIADGTIQNVDLANSSITVNPGVGLTGGGNVPLGGSVTLSAAQDIATTASPTFNGLTLTGKASSASTVAGDPGTTLATKDYVDALAGAGITTDGTLTGDGTGGSPLGLNLASPNTFTATQTLPTTAGQGDALIASTNAGTTTIDAARIGTGLTDAQVNNNLTIDGGTINNTAIGATTPSTGAFTDIDGATLDLTGKATSASTVAADPGTTLATKDYVDALAGGTLTTDATLTGDGTGGSPLGLNLANDNTFTGTQTLATTPAQGDALIASTNAGTTTIDAARIGAGLTDAQVDDNLTIDGGTINNTAIGATTPSTGAFTDIDGATLDLTGKATSASTVAADPGNTLATKDYVDGLESSVTTDATLTGDGTAATPLGLNLANANTFTATQTLPVDAAQGDALIASTNAGTATIDAARIGTGLTDAQVDDNLTIDGGTINNTAIGATTPSTGAFTTVDVTGKATSASTVAADPGNTLTTKDYVDGLESSVTTDATLTGDGTAATPLGLNLANANTFTATQTLPVDAAQGDALIASTNAGTATIDAARIGTGLTDAQVDDNLTIDGGTINNTAIGATTPSTGAFTDIDGATLDLTGKATSASTVAADPGNTLATKDYVDGLESSVTTDATLTGDGTAATPLGLNLANDNTWTGIQSFADVDTQGDEFIGSINSSTSMTINADRIGTGLTDAQVDDNLTIDGGTINNTAIGATTPSTGVFTDIDGATLDLTGKATSASTVAADPGNTLATKDYVDGLESSVTTDATLTGDGTAATPLGLNLANPNTFTATQTLPVDAAQGDALIASTNAGTATIDAARIGTGLTDAQVDDNLTIDGGTINNTAIGATTPSTGAFTTVDVTGKATSASTVAADPGNTLATKDYVDGLESSVTTDATLTGDGTAATPLGLNLANPNTFTATQTLPVDAAQGDALIASTNAGTTTIDAARIGTGLTDAQVDDNLTIDGGTINNTAIGATTPNTGAFTDIDGATLDLTGKATSASTVAADPGNTLATKDYVDGLESSVTTDATLTGDGTAATPLGLNLANPNTFTATQTLPVDAAQGDALIASTNAGTATIDAARIGTGLTDAQVDDNLTIDGGTINNTAIGATTPNTGAFTDIDGATLDLTGKATSASTVAADPGNTLATKDYVDGLESSVTTDATLTGDGTAATPLGLNLANANTFTATQTLPVDAAQGDALIASTNAGTATIDAARIGTGLTDAQVDDNLTIDGGTINNTAIGAVTPNTGAFTDIDGATLDLTSKATSASTVAADPGNTLTTKDYVDGLESSVTTDATLTGDGTTDAPLGLNLANANTFTATQTLPVDAAQGDALIASTNAGTTTIDAARIGTGLTDAQVDDNLTIDGGTINNTAIGATTPSTGAFTDIDGATLDLTGKATSASTVAADPGNTLATKDYVDGLESSVTTDATLTGDGTTDAPLGLNLANANTFTATQTLPVDAAQGDALIASTNAGTTTIDAARIGTGLTDAQVGDALTIDGGTINNTAIGATTPSTGAFTDIDGGTLDLTGKATSASTVAADPATTLTTKDYVDNSIASNAWVLGGNTAPTSNTLGTNDATDLILETNNTQRMILRGDGTMAFGNTAPVYTSNIVEVDLANVGGPITTGEQNQGFSVLANSLDGAARSIALRSRLNVTDNVTGAQAIVGSLGVSGTNVGDVASAYFNARVAAGGSLTAIAGVTGVGADAEAAAGGTYTPANNFIGGRFGADGTNIGDGSAIGMFGAAITPHTGLNAGSIALAAGASPGADIASAGFANATVADVGGVLPTLGADFSTGLLGHNQTNGANDYALYTTGSKVRIGSLTGGGIRLVAADPNGVLVNAAPDLLNGTVSVETDATLTGDGTTATPLGLNLANDNTFTGTQTLATTAAQGDALIASTNAGTTTIDAARIGAGLTDAQVGDALTITGGTIDATPIGATTPSTGAFTDIDGATLDLTGKATSASTVAADPGNTLATKDYVDGLESAVVTDATLTGDGTAATPLGLNLANANTFTATQTLPTTAAQGDALIASTNAGTTTIDATRIGGGLTDAQVNDNLTITGGTIDATPIGATTPSTGAFTDVDGATLDLTGKATSASTVAADPGNTLATKDYVDGLESSVTTDATLTGDGTAATPLGLNLANANTFTATQTLPTTAAQGDALIASTNAGTTTIDAARIGGGLTDAQVNDNLTITGGTIDATPIGATTPSTGAFTDVDGATLDLTGKATSASTVGADPGNTLTTKDYVDGLESSVTTDATLTGNGTAATPLGLNLANANTFTATQTLPTTAAQGDALIASTNAGTTTIDATRIGGGLTDAQVNDNLTITGGTIDATPIGATTPSTGAFTDVDGATLDLTGKATSASTVGADPGNTLTTKDYVDGLESSVTTDATLTGNGTAATPLGLNLANPNTFTATQTLPVDAAQGDALIASTNAGTTTIDAARIGAGLTDAQVDDNLTINGGTIDNTSIGAVTPSTGAFTDIDGLTLDLIGKATSASTLPGDPGNTLATKDYVDGLESSVTTDATLTGNGTAATPLGLNLANPNTFTATQTLPVDAAQGDALIASTNAGTTTIDAARIGAGLTDAQVNDNLTINGGTIDATPIGATTPSTGAFTDVDGATLDLTGKATSASTVGADPGNTLTTKDYVDALENPVVTDATLAGNGTAATPLGLNLANPNTFTATQTLPVDAAQGDALIASTNAGTTTIDAARIGAGLADAQVNDNLTINGGAIDATPIGLTTQSSGDFTTVTATTALGAGNTPDAGTVYADNVVIAWGDIDGNGIFNAQFGNIAITHTVGTGVYTIVLPNTPTAASTIVTLQALGLSTVTRAGSVLTVTTYDLAGTPTDLSFNFQTVGRP